MNEHLKEISTQVTAGAHAALILACLRVAASAKAGRGRLASDRWGTMHARQHHLALRPMTILKNAASPHRLNLMPMRLARATLSGTVLVQVARTRRAETILERESGLMPAGRAFWTTFQRQPKPHPAFKGESNMVERRGFISCAICAAAGLIASGGKAGARASAGFTRAIIQKSEKPGDKYACVLVAVDIEPNALIARHTHPGIESGYVVSGGGVLSVKGQPDRAVKAGDGFQLQPETPHSLRNGPEKSRVTATYIVEKDKPLASPAPE